MKSPYFLNGDLKDASYLASQIVQAAADQNLFVEQDPYGNVFVRKPANQNRRSVLLHGYTYAAAFLMTELICASKIHCPELEFLFSTRDHTNRSSVRDFDMSQIRSRLVINLDAETEEEIISSCAGFVRLVFETEIIRSQPMRGALPVQVRIFGLKGGHSARDIQKGHANAIKLMGEFLFDWYNYSVDTQLVGVNGGLFTNSIPTECTARLLIREDLRENFERGCWWFGEDLNKRFASIDPDARIEVTFPSANTEDDTWRPMPVDETGRIISFLNLCPNGAINMLQKSENQVETSCNIRNVVTEMDRWRLFTSIRSFDDSKKNALRDEFELLAELNRIGFTSIGDFPSWKHENVSNMQNRYEQAYKYCTGRPVKVVAAPEEQELMLFFQAMRDVEAICVGVNTKDGRPETESLERISKVLKTMFDRFFNKQTP